MAMDAGKEITYGAINDKARAKIWGLSRNLRKKPGLGIN